MEEGRDKGAGIREKSREIVDLVNNPVQLRAEREKARQGRDKYIGIGSSGQTVTTAVGAPPPGTGYDNSFGTAQYAARDGGSNPTVLTATVVSGPKHLPEKSKLEELRRQDRERQRQRAMADDEAARKRREEEQRIRQEQQQQRQRQQQRQVAEESEESSSESSTSSSSSDEESPVARQPVRRPPPPPPQQRRPRPPPPPPQQSVDLLNMNAWPQQQQQQPQPVAYQGAPQVQTTAGAYPGQQQSYGYAGYYGQQQAGYAQPPMGNMPLPQQPYQPYQQPQQQQQQQGGANPFAGYPQQASNPFAASQGAGGLQQFRGL
ncbi:hypothetical protein FOZ61_008038 [Perkinsus olseni]|nr:hypothetical protein FOZ61_008038 [Perkinsus olseni]